MANHTERRTFDGRGNAGADRPGAATRPSTRRRGRPEQLAMIEEAKRDWRIDDDTRRRGLKGLEEARAALRQAGRRAA
ncbi:MAG TPA: hypothetical protein VE990_12795 [Acidimicrobiales bacterium]|nr:hypothetical protein [Acidimicrobiales bacterium]